MKILEQKGEKFFVNASISPNKLGNKNPLDFVQVNKADIVVKHQDQFLYLEWIPPLEIIEPTTEVLTNDEQSIQRVEEVEAPNVETEPTV
jgi:hypothetical protein